MIEQNNPGNLRPLPEGQMWHGQTGVVVQPNGEALCVFDTPANGIRALGLNLLAYWSAGYRTCRTISAHWAPAGDGNDPDAYANAIASMLGCGINAEQDFRNRHVLAAYGKAVSIEENGHPAPGDPCWYTNADWSAGMYSALLYHFTSFPTVGISDALPMPRHAPPAPNPDDSANALNEAELAAVESGSAT